MKKIVCIPLDERPCTYDYPSMMSKMATDINYVQIPREYMGDCKIAGNLEKMQEFLLEECKDADYAIVAIDSILYGGIVPSRLHYASEETLLERLNVLRKIKENNPKLKLYAYHLIMRCPSGSGSDEEPDYYGLCGREIHVIGYYDHKSAVTTLTDEEQKVYNDAKEFIKANHHEADVKDYLDRRKINTLMNKHSVNLVKEGVIDFLIIPQDDSAPYGLTAKDQMLVREEISKLKIDLKVLMYPDADAVTNSLLAKTINEINNVRPRVFVRYASCNEGNIIPNYEDRPVAESIKYQILAAGGIQVHDYSMSDLVLMVNVPLANMAETRRLYDDLHKKENPGETDLNYTVGRNLVEYVEYIKYLISINKTVAVADIAYANGGDTILFNLLKNEDLLFKVDSYAGWNTAANTLGTCIPLAMINKLYPNTQGFLDFMAMRYLEDVGYQSNVRFEAFDKFRSKYAWGKIDGKTDGEVATYIKKGLENWAEENLNGNEYKVEIVKHQQPWDRFFETEVICKTHKK